MVGEREVEKRMGSRVMEIIMDMSQVYYTE